MKDFVKQAKRYFIDWWMPISINAFVIVIFLIGAVLRRDWIVDLSLIVFFVNLIGTIISSIVQIFMRKWYFIIPQIGIAVILVYYITIIFMYSPPDYYGTHKVIPEHMDFVRPLDTLPKEKAFETYDFVVINDFQPGLYLYQTDHKPSEKGYFYVKAYEVNSNDRLSEDRMNQQSKVIVDNLEHRIWNGEFTIYEGDWGDPYGSRIELWYQPINRAAYKIQERLYIIEGWQR